MRKGQIQQVFIYIMALLVIGFLVVMGFRFIPSIMQQSCEVEDTQFLVNTKQVLDRATTYGRVTNPRINMPCDYTILCFVNTSSIGKNDFEALSTDDPNLRQRYQVIQSSVRDGIEFNVYLVQEGASGTTRPVLYDDRIHTKDEPMTCIRASNRQFSFWTQGKGNAILIYTEE